MQKEKKKRVREMAVYGSLCHSGFMLAAQFDEGKRGTRAEASEANNTSVQR